jgi:hypothetical protein
MQRTFAALITATLLAHSVQAENTTLQDNHPYVGLWVTGDGHIRHELLPNGRYVEARGMRERAYKDRYEVTGSISNTGTIQASPRTAILSTTSCITLA